MIYVALLRGINVGGNRKVPMSDLRMLFSKLGFKDVSTYINSGNVIFGCPTTSTTKLAHKIEVSIEQEFGFGVDVTVRTAQSIKEISKTVPASWTNDKSTKTDVMFLWDTYNSVTTLDDIPNKQGIDDVVYVDGAIIWRVDKKNVTKSGLLRIVGTDLYKHMTIRNINTVRKLAELTSAL